MKIFLDDWRENPGDEWTKTETVNETIALKETHKVTNLSLDYDLGDKDTLTGMAVVEWVLVKAVKDESYIPPRTEVHSTHPYGREEMIPSVKKINALRVQRILREKERC